MDEKNITFVNENHRFNLRVAILIEYKDMVLLENSGNFWNMIGGRVHFGESTLEAAKRELKEELGISISNMILINVSENFFSWMGYDQQEMLFIYKAKIDESFECVKQEEFKCLDSDEMFKWHNKRDVERLICKPEIIKSLVKDNKVLSHTIEK